MNGSVSPVRGKSPKFTAILMSAWTAIHTETRQANTNHRLAFDSAITTGTLARRTMYIGRIFKRSGT